MEDKRTVYADLALLFVAIVWGSGFVVTKNSLEHLTPMYLVFYRFIIASVLLGIIMHKRLLRAEKKDIKAGMLIGVFLFGGFAFQTVGLQYTQAGTQAFITATYVVMVPFLYWAIAKKKPDKYELFAALVCTIGIGILSLGDNLSMGYGEFLTLICAVMFALHVASIGYFAPKSDTIVIAVVQLATTAVLSLILALFTEGVNFTIHRDAIGGIVYLGVFSSMLAFLIQTVAQKYTTSTHTAIILSMEAVFGSILGIIILNEDITIKFLIGCFAILVAVITSETKWKFLRKKKQIDNF